MLGKSCKRLECTVINTLNSHKYMNFDNYIVKAFDF